MDLTPTDWFSLIAAFVTGAPLRETLTWWLWLWILGLLFLPLAQTIFHPFFDRGYLFAKPLGLALTAYTVWLLSSCRLLPFGLGSIYACLAGWAILIFMACRKILARQDYPQRAILIEEAVFLCALLAWAFVRTLHPELRGLEKFMDFGFVNSILRAPCLPPVDPWLAGESINYYYFGHYVCAFLSVLTRLDSAVAYNLMIATLFAMTFSLTLSLGANLHDLCRRPSPSGKWVCGGVAALLVTLGGNLHTFLYAVALPLLSKAKIIGGTVWPYSFYSATRYIGYNPPAADKTIHEFPGYSFVVSDLHAQVSSIPYALTLLALMISLSISAAAQPLAHDSPRARRWQFKPAHVFLGFILGIAYMTNTWDVPIYGVIAALMLGTGHWVQIGSWTTALALTVRQMLAVLLIALITALPFNLHFFSFAHGLWFTHSTSPFYQLIVVWGGAIAFGILFAVFLASRIRSSCHDETRSRRFAGFTEGLRRIPPADRIVAILFLSAAGLVLIPELVYIRHSIANEYYRANTMFKMGYQAFILAGLSSGYVFTRLGGFRGVSLPEKGLTMAMTILILLPLLFPIVALRQFYPRPPLSQYTGLDGLRPMAFHHPADYQAVLYFRQVIQGSPVILEANGISFSDFGRISAATGLPTVLGWRHHETLWRGGDPEVLARIADIAAMYESPDVVMTKSLLLKYRIRYIIVGEMEYKKFERLNKAKLLTLGPVVFHHQDTFIIKVLCASPYHSAPL